MPISSLTNEKVQQVCLLIITMVAATTALIYTREVLVPLVIALFLYAVLAETTRYLQRKLKIPKWVAIVISLISYSIIISLVVIFSVASVKQFIANIDVFRTKAIDLINYANRFLAYFDYQINETFFQDEIKTFPLMEWAQNITGGVAHFLGDMLLILLFIFFMVLGETKKSERASEIMKSVQEKISDYILIKFFLSVAVAFFVGIILFSCQIELAFLFTFLTFALNFIPNVGSIIATLLPIPIALLQYGFSWQLAVISVVPISIHFVVGNIVETKLMGDNMELHPITVMVFLIFWSLVWGIPGAFLAVPITAILRGLLYRMEATRPLSEMLAGRFT